MDKQQCGTCGYYEGDTGECGYWGAPIEVVEECDEYVVYEQ